jgi:DNA-binding cell septation regulator SpoVG
MQISEIQIIPIKPNNGLVAMASVVVENSLYLGSIGIHTKLNGNGFRITYPTKNLSGKNFNVFHPINRNVALDIEQAIIAKAEEVLSYQNKKSNEYVGHCNTHNTERVL